VYHPTIRTNLEDILPNPRLQEDSPKKVTSVRRILSGSNVPRNPGPRGKRSRTPRDPTTISLRVLYDLSRASSLTMIEGKKLSGDGLNSVGSNPVVFPVNKSCTVCVPRRLWCDMISISCVHNVLFSDKEGNNPSSLGIDFSDRKGRGSCCSKDGVVGDDDDRWSMTSMSRKSGAETRCDDELVWLRAKEPKIRKIKNQELVTGAVLLSAVEFFL